MQNNSSREDILKKIANVHSRRSPILQNTPWSNEEIYKPILPDAVSCFKYELESISGQCMLCKSEEDLYLQLADFLTSRSISLVYCRDSTINEHLAQYQIQSTRETHDFETMQVGITACEFLIARTGSVVVSSSSESGRQMNVFPPIHIVIASSSQLKAYPDDALFAIQSKYGTNLPSSISIITGPSRTADIEKTLVLGAHGPKEFIVFLY